MLGIRSCSYAVVEVLFVEEAGVERLLLEVAYPYASVDSYHSSCIVKVVDSYHSCTDSRILC